MVSCNKCLLCLFFLLCYMYGLFIIFTGTEVSKNVTTQQGKSGAQGFLCAGMSIKVVIQHYCCTSL